MKKISLLILSAVILSIALGLTVGAFHKFPSNSNINVLNHSSKKGHSTINQSKEYSLDSIDNLKITTNSIDMNIISADSTNIKAHLHGNIFSTSKINLPKLVLSKNNVSLDISILRKSSSSFIKTYSSDVVLDIYVPKSYKKSFMTNTSSGNINFSDLNTSNTKLNSTSGDIVLKHSKADSLECSSNSGNINLEDISSKSINLKSNSGDNDLKNVTTDNLSFHSTSGYFIGNTISSLDSKLSTSSGDINIDNFSGNLISYTSSGKISIVYKKLNNNIKLYSNSGDISLMIPKNSEFYFNGTSNSGDIHSDFSISSNNLNRDSELEGTVKNNKNKLLLKTTSGNIELLSK